MSRSAQKVFVRGDIGAGRVTVDAGNHHIFIDGAQQAPMKQQDIPLAHLPTARRCTGPGRR